MEQEAERRRCSSEVSPTPTTEPTSPPPAAPRLSPYSPYGLVLPGWTAAAAAAAAAAASRQLGRPVPATRLPPMDVQQLSCPVCKRTLSSAGALEAHVKRCSASLSPRQLPAGVAQSSTKTAHERSFEVGRSRRGVREMLHDD